MLRFLKQLFSSEPDPDLHGRDLFYLTSDAQLQGILRHIEQLVDSAADAILLVAHFPALLHQLEELVTQLPEDWPVRALLAESLPAQVASGMQLRETDRIEIIVAELHPLPETDLQPQRFSAALSCRSEVVRFLSLQDPFLQTIISDSFRSMIQKLMGGDGEQSEAIESNMATRSVLRAQRDLRARVKDPVPAESLQQWLQLNAPDTAH